MSSLLEIDEIDRNIIKIVQAEPNLTHTQIAKRVNRSQPTVGMRIRKLEEVGVLKFTAGINMKAADFFFARVDIQTNNPDEICSIVNKCPFMLNAFAISGVYNVSIFLAGLSIKDIDEIVNINFRKNPNIINLKMEMITNVLNDYVLPLNFTEMADCGVREGQRVCEKCME